MSRLTISPQISKFARVAQTLSSSSHAGQLLGLCDSQARFSRSIPLNRVNKIGNNNDLVDRLATHDIASTHGFHTAQTHRPAMATAAYKTIPLMQGFTTSASKQTSHHASPSIDFISFPSASSSSPDHVATRLRGPLLPDNYSPKRSPELGHATEALDGAIARPEICVVASHPEDVVPAVIGEVVGNDALDISLDQLIATFSGSSRKATEPSLLTDVWSGLMDDVMSTTTANKVAF